MLAGVRTAPESWVGGWLFMLIAVEKPFQGSLYTTCHGLISRCSQYRFVKRAKRLENNSVIAAERGAQPLSVGWICEWCCVRRLASQAKARGCRDAVHHYLGIGRNRIEKENELCEGCSLLKVAKEPASTPRQIPPPGGSFAVTLAPPTFFVDPGGVLLTPRLSPDFFSAHVCAYPSHSALQVFDRERVTFAS